MNRVVFRVLFVVSAIVCGFATLMLVNPLTPVGYTGNERLAVYAALTAIAVAAFFSARFFNRKLKQLANGQAGGKV